MFDFEKEGVSFFRATTIEKKSIVVVVVITVDLNINRVLKPNLKSLSRGFSNMVGPTLNCIKFFKI